MFAVVPAMLCSTFKHTSMGKSLNLTVVAEGVETAEQEYYLSQRGCALAQGYFFSKPLLPRDFENFVQTFHARIVENNA